MKEDSTFFFCNVCNEMREFLPAVDPDENRKYYLCSECSFQREFGE